MSGQRRAGRGRKQQRSSEWVVWAVVAVVTVVACAAVVLVMTRHDTQTPNSVAGPINAESLYAQHCGSCHGIDGGGAIGPKLSDGAVVDAFPDIDDQIDVITDGLEGTPAMPPFDDALSDAEIRAIAEYERAL